MPAEEAPILPPLSWQQPDSLYPDSLHPAASALANVQQAAQECWAGARLSERFPLDGRGLNGEPALLVALHKRALDRLMAQAADAERELLEASALPDGVQRKAGRLCYVC